VTPFAAALGMLFRDERGAVPPGRAPRPSGPRRANSPLPPIFTFDDDVEDDEDGDPDRRRNAKAHSPRVWLYASVGVLGAATAAVAAALWRSPPHAAPASAAARDSTSRVTPERPAPAPAPVVPPPTPRSVEHVPPRASRSASGGVLSVNAQPWGHVYIDDSLVGTTPKVGVTVAAGRHRVRVTRDGFAPATREVLVPPGGRVRVTDIILQELKP